MVCLRGPSSRSVFTVRLHGCHRLVFAGDGEQAAVRREEHHRPHERAAAGAGATQAGHHRGEGEKVVRRSPEGRQEVVSARRSDRVFSMCLFDCQCPPPPPPAVVSLAGIVSLLLVSHRVLRASIVPPMLVSCPSCWYRVPPAGIVSLLLVSCRVSHAGIVSLLLVSCRVSHAGIVSLLLVSCPSCWYRVVSHALVSCRQRKEREIQQKLEKTEESAVTCHDTYASLQQEVDVKTRKLKKVRPTPPTPHPP